MKCIEENQIIRAGLIIEMCEYCKDNIFESNMANHHSSLGQIHAFGYQGVFKRVQNSTVGLYEIQKRYKDDRQHDVEDAAITIEEMISVEISSASFQLSSIVENINKLLQPVMDIANEKQRVEEYGDFKKNRRISVHQCEISMYVSMLRQGGSILRRMPLIH